MPAEPKTITHADLARALGVTVTTIKSYRRKFPEFWTTDGQGKPLRFPPQALALARAIRDHFDRGFSVEETRKRLGQTFEAFAHPAPAVPAPAAPAEQAPEPLARIEALLEGLFTLQNRTHSLLAELLAKLDSLAPDAKISGMTPGPAPRKEPPPRRAPAAPAAPAPQAQDEPPGAFLDLPVVVLAADGVSYLGMTRASGGPFTLRHFEGFLLRRAGNGNARAPRWRRQGEVWILPVESHGQTHDHHFQEAVTPRGNAVARFASLSVAGKPASEAALQALLRQMKESPEP